MKKSVILLLFVFLTQLLWAQLELPSRLTDRPERIIRHEAYTCSFNTSNLTPNYVAWCLTSERVKGYTKRTDFFDGDPKIESKYRVQHSDYSRSRYDRGHMCPAADNRQSYTAMTESFYMTNICPQNHALNVGAWNDLEIQCRTWAVNYGKVYIVAGPIYDKPVPARIGSRRSHRIAVPDRFFKVILMNGRVPKAIGFIYANRNETRPMRSYAVSVDQVERITGIDFFPQLDDKTERRIEAECNPAAWNL